MRAGVALAAALAMIGAALYFTRREPVISEALGVAENSITEMVDTVKTTYNNLTIDPRNVLNDPNVRAFMAVIRMAEGTADAGGYSRLFGGGQFTSYADHPRIHVPFRNTTSTAAGAYQILQGTWDEIAAKYDLPDFSPSSQDIAAVGLIKRRGALGDVLAGRFASAIQKCNREWASLPGSPYGQPTITMAKAAAILAGNGVTSAEAMV